MSCELWITQLDPSIQKVAFTPDEDRRLLDLYAVHGQHWRLLSQFMPGRSDGQCKRRYTRALDPALNKGPWSPDEDRALAELQAVHGDKWAIMARELPGRSGYLCRERWHHVLAKRNKPQDDREGS